jgi:hypothetical protein
MNQKNRERERERKRERGGIGFGRQRHTKLNLRKGCKRDESVPRRVLATIRAGKNKFDRITITATPF